MAALELREVLENGLEGRLVLFEVSGSRRLPVAVDELVELNHASVEAYKLQQQDESHG